jgi:hypothetical protein
MPAPAHKIPNKPWTGISGSERAIHTKPSIPENARPERRKGNELEEEIDAAMVKRFKSGRRLRFKPILRENPTAPGIQARIAPNKPPFCPLIAAGAAAT